MQRKAPDDGDRCLSNGKHFVIESQEQGPDILSLGQVAVEAGIE